MGLHAFVKRAHPNGFSASDPIERVGCPGDKWESNEGDTYLMPLICAMLWWEIRDTAEITWGKQRDKRNINAGFFIGHAISLNFFWLCGFIDVFF